MFGQIDVWFSEFEIQLSIESVSYIHVIWVVIWMGENQALET